MSLIKVTAEDLATLSGQLNGYAQTIDETNMTAMNTVNGVVGGAWEGVAAQQFHALFEQWKSGADQTRQAMQGISQLVNNAAQAYSSTEEQIAGSMRQ